MTIQLFRMAFCNRVIFCFYCFRIFNPKITSNSTFFIVIVFLYNMTSNLQNQSKLYDAKIIKKKFIGRDFTPSPDIFLDQHEAHLIL